MSSNIDCNTMNHISIKCIDELNRILDNPSCLSYLSQNKNSNFSYEIYIMHGKFGFRPFSLELYGINRHECNVLFSFFDSGTLFFETYLCNLLFCKASLKVLEWVPDRYRGKIYSEVQIESLEVDFRYNDNY